MRCHGSLHGHAILHGWDYPREEKNSGDSPHSLRSVGSLSQFLWTERRVLSWGFKCLCHHCTVHSARRVTSGGRAGRGGKKREKEEEETGFPHLLYVTESSIFAATPSVQFSIEAISRAEPEHERGRSRKLTPVLGRTSGVAPLPGALPQLTLQSPLQGPGVLAVGRRGERLAWAPAIWPPSVSPSPGVYQRGGRCGGFTFREAVHAARREEERVVGRELQPPGPGSDEAGLRELR